MSRRRLSFRRRTEPSLVVFLSVRRRPVASKGPDNNSSTACHIAARFGSYARKPNCLACLLQISSPAPGDRPTSTLRRHSSFAAFAPEPFSYFSQGKRPAANRAALVRYSPTGDALTADFSLSIRSARWLVSSEFLSPLRSRTGNSCSSTSSPSTAILEEDDRPDCQKPSSITTTPTSLNSTSGGPDRY